MATKKIGQLCGIGIRRIVDPVGVRMRCEFVSVKQPSIEFEIAGDLALGIANELEVLLRIRGRKQKSKAKSKSRSAAGKSRRRL
jgi:hypothetical protein